MSSKCKVKRFLNRAIVPFCNRKAVDESANSGIRFTVGLTVSIMCLSIMLILFTIFLNGAKEIKDNDAKYRQQENDSISFKYDYQNGNHDQVLNKLGALV